MLWELVGAVVGAGMASGREIASFFAVHGWRGYLGIAAAGMIMGLLGTIDHPIIWPEPWLGKLWKGLLGALMITTGGAMLSGAGEIAALILPVRPAYWAGMIGTLLLGWALARKTEYGLAAVSKVLLLVLGAVIMISLFSQPQEACVVRSASTLGWAVSGVMYGGFNAALQVPILQQAIGYKENRRRDVWRSCIVICVVLCLGNTALLRNPRWLAEPMPFMLAAAAIGKCGYALSAASLYFALLSTLIACFKGVKGDVLPMLAFAVVSQLGFTGVVEKMYPLLGTCCLVMLLWAKFLKCASNPFHSS